MLHVISEKHANDRHLNRNSKYQRNILETSGDKFWTNLPTYQTPFGDEVFDQFPYMQSRLQANFKKEWHPGLSEGLPKLHYTQHDDYRHPKPHHRSKRQSEIFKSRGPPSCRRFARQQCN